MIFGKLVNRYYLKYWYYFFFGILAIIAVDIVQLYIPEIIGSAVSHLNLGTMTNEFLLRNLFAMLGIAAAIFVGRMLWRICINGVAHKITKDIRYRLFTHCQNLPKEFYTTHKTGALMALYTNDIDTIGYSFSDGTLFLVDFLALGATALIKMMMMNWMLTLISMIPLLFLFLSARYFEKKESTAFEDSQKSYEDLSDFTTENLSGISVIKAFVKEKEQIVAFDRHNEQNRKLTFRASKIDNAYNSIINLCIYIGFASIIFFVSIAGYYGFKTPGVDSLDGGQLTTFYGYFDTLIWPILAIVFYITTGARGKASYRRVREIFNEPIKVKDRDDVTVVEEVKGDITIRNLSFNYPDGGTPALKNLSIDIKAGQNIGIIGRTGSGKSTLVNMLLKFYNVPDGTIMLDGIDINNWPTVDLREHIGYVAQDTFLFSTSIRENIAFFNPSIDEERVRQAARFACVDENISGFKEGYDTVVGERGVTLSGGQKQRIAMARAIVKDPQILILDDSVSAVDSSTEKEILKNIKTLRQGKTTLIIAHRVSAIEDLDAIIVIDNGEVVGFGTHDELLKTSVVYQKIVQLQELEKEVI